MSKKTLQDIQNTEYDWIACDGNGNVAVFTTAGGSYAPDPFLEDTDAHDAAIDAILADPPQTRCLFAPDLPPGWRNPWKLLAERGLFAFDGDVFGGPYKLDAAPDQPAHIDALPRAAQAVLSALTYPELSFRDLQVIPGELLERYRR